MTDKMDHLRQIIKMLPSSAVAFSGGVDSALLASVLLEVQGDQALALTVDSIFASREEMEDAINFATEIGIEHQMIALDEMDDSVMANPVDRCYHCKKKVFSTLLETAQALGRNILLDGSNLDDLDDYRPGMKAIKELGVKSPFLEAQLTKAEIRKFSKARGLSIWNKPSMACLASRIPYDDPITSESLRMVETAEKYLITRGLIRFRVRKHGNLARIEVSPEERPLFFDLTLMEEVSSELKKIGFRFVALDLQGYRTGSLN
ncbi:MAG: ATP-dependent sacrificial sulfur transferase LarE [Deltaproteobacteria bacterium]|nr:ATP-dependent sacrificial sulfur transferase LarE [Deltaproteobacteria bacterium]MBT4640804.1 ATP-dependent sacrificial sulfur transferase LarE [Deltaproteobacteria bacterium]MBT6503589.1 ATP-dependent sacrificial sulfur transferase LarE [Deltaproteobacteria bacterium]MBT6613818.1 ATP-dependent sacrificial sulfur transferase LarE [Deltaproteobacteria bacterium]MBT7151393.1 ATP-dependent sacrificial sulfur transferase LarE [Deltaproteobacteria bacterium]